MIQLILDGMQLPESQNGGYRAWEEDLTVDVEMISGWLVRESRGVIWKISYQYGWFNDENRARVLAAIRKGRKYPITCTFLPPESEDLITSDFCIVKSTEPKFMWSSNGKPLWGDFSFELREERPH